MRGGEWNVILENDERRLYNIDVNLDKSIDVLYFRVYSTINNPQHIQCSSKLSKLQQFQIQNYVSGYPSFGLDTTLG